MQQKRHRLIYGLSVRRCEVYRSRRRFTGRIVSCWKPVYWRGWVRGRGQRGHFEGRARWFSRDFTCSHPPILSRALCSHWCFPPPPISSQKLLFSLGGSFLYYADHFKLYSGFCANHIKVQKVLERGTTHILIFCIVTRNSMQKQTNPPPLNLASVLLCCVRGSSAAHGWRFGLLFWEANQLCMKVNVPEWDGGWKRGERCLSSLAPVPLQLQHHARRSTRLSTFQFVIDTFKALSPFSPQTDDV